LERDEVLSAALEKWKAPALCDLARDVVELHSSLGHDSGTLLGWADEAYPLDGGPEKRDSRARAASEAVAELLRPLWSEAWEVWDSIFSELFREIGDARDRALEKPAAKRASPAVALAGIMERRQGLLDAFPPLSAEERQRLFFFDLCSNLTGDSSNLFKAVAECLGQTASTWRKKREKWLPLSESSPRSPLSESEQRLRAALLRFCAFAWRVWDEVKRRRDLLSFSDLIRFATLSIREDPRKKGFRHVLIDEFQDTDPLQDAMIRALREKEGAKLFLVGDPKQAIYRFRHADLTLFADYVLQSRASGSDIDLNVSFRTRSALLKPLNDLFAYIWKDGLGSGARMRDLKFEPLYAPDEANATNSTNATKISERELASVPPLALLLSPKKGRETRPSRMRLAESLARLLARCVENRETVWDKREGCLRPVRWGDFAVLTPTRGAYEILEEAFEKAGVPAAFKKSMSYFTRGEVTDVIDTLRAAAFDDDETALAGWLASPFSGVPQDEVQSFLQTLAGIRKTRKTRKTREESSEASFFRLLRDCLPNAADRLTRLRRIGSLKGPSAMLSHLLEDRRWLSAFDGAQRFRVVGNVGRAIAVARQYEGGVSVSLAGCARWLDTALRSGRPTEEPEWLDENADAVRVMTVHAAKGLEFPVVAVMQMENSALRRASAETVIASRNMGVALSAVPDRMKPEAEGGEIFGEFGESGESGAESESEVKLLSLRWERALSEQGDLEESQRLFYVAATRAQDSLILCGVANEDKDGGRSVKGESWLAWTLDWIEAGGRCPILKGDFPLPQTQTQTQTQPPPLATRFPDPAGAAGSAPPLFFREAGEGVWGLRLQEGSGDSVPSLSSFSATSFALFEWCPFAWRRRHRQGLDLRWEVPDNFNDDDGDGKGKRGESSGGAEVGSLAHWVLARWDMREETLGEWLDESAVRVARLLPATLRDAWRDAKNRDTLRGWLSAFSVSEEGRALADALKNGELKRESAFSVTLGGVRLVGATDALWRDGGRWHVRDYKITLSDNAPSELYRAQLAFYALAAKLLAERA
jgi:ATP-dependent exoDNAse (exonuclease V) beta subunit